MDDCNTTFLLGRPNFRCYVSFREGTTVGLLFVVYPQVDNQRLGPFVAHIVTDIGREKIQELGTKFATSSWTWMIFRPNLSYGFQTLNKGHGPFLPTYSLPRCQVFGILTGMPFRSEIVRVGRVESWWQGVLICWLLMSRNSINFGVIHVLYMLLHLETMARVVVPWCSIKT